MRAMRGLLAVTTGTLVVVGVIRGGVVSIVARLKWVAALKLTALNIVVALVWLPITALAMRIVDARLTTGRRIAALASLGIFSVVVEAWSSAILRLAGAPIPGFLARFLGRSDTNALFYIAIVGVCFAVSGRRRQIASEIAAERVHAAVAGAQLHVLTLQLHPHFLFNALNLISQLAYESVDAAQRAVSNLRALLVESLRHAVHREVPFASELSFLRAYLEIQQARFRDRLKISISAGRDVERAAVPHLVLQPIVENAIVHGISPHSAAGVIEISARRDGDRLLLTVDDDGPGCSSNVRDGVGLTNTRLRLEQLFGADHRLSLSARSPHGTSVMVDIPFRAIEESRDDVGADAEIETGVADGDSAQSRRAPVWLPIVAGWGAVAMIWTEIGALPTPARSADFNYSATLLAYLINVALWIALTPPVVGLARKFEPGARPALPTMLIHFVLSIVTATVHTGAWLVALYAVGSPVFPQILRSMFGWGIWDMAAYIAIVALTTVVALSARFRDSRLVIARAQARLASARVASLRLRLQPRILLASLDSLAHVIARDAEAAEATIARLGDLLRMLLSRADREFVTLGEELELLDAYLDVVGAVRTRLPADFPRVGDVADELVPAMMLPTLAAAFHGEIDVVQLHAENARLRIAVRSGQSSIDADALAECLDRLRGLYAGAERTTVERDGSGRTVVDVELPRQRDTEAHSLEAYDLATA